MNPIKAGETAVTIAEALAPEATKVAESAAQRLLEAGGVLAPPIRSEAVSEAISSLGGKLPEGLPKYLANLPKYLGKSADDFHIVNVGDVGAYPTNDSVSKIMGLGVEHANEHLSDMALGALNRHREASLLDGGINWQVGKTDHSEWTPAVRDMMRKAFLKTEG